MKDGASFNLEPGPMPMIRNHKHATLVTVFAALLAIALLSHAAPGAPGAPAALAAPGNDAPAQAVRLVIDYGDGSQKVFTRVPWREHMTVLDAMNHAKKHPRGVTFEHRGRGETAFLTQIDELRNEGGGAGNRNWQFWVNGQRAQQGFGALELKQNDAVEWRFATFEP
jgi:hypothetical protein